MTTSNPTPLTAFRRSCLDRRRDPSAHTTASPTDPGDKAWKANLTLDKPAQDKLHLKGLVNGAPVEASLHRIDESHFAVKEEGLRSQVGA